MSGLADSTRPSLSAHALLVRYIVFAVVSGLLNLAGQEFVVCTLPMLPVMVSIFFGTGVGFISKYLLDKRWIFFDRYENHGAEARKVMLYGFFGVGTTVIFWGVELGSWLFWQTTTAKYGGAIVGLAFGNWIKYLLDKRFVFRNLK
ncbi:GtrA family protein [Acetobacter okinawensis]|uniref:GtrA family protein n=1 Tax=Acetobacter okinawensis TaxID=1076594 RepID=UPI0020A09E33|nr:GtrA family protein [Acetobacter okinawensis]MCP1212451.1 GtrA family protein [Acetobacter okinawensis]